MKKVYAFDMGKASIGYCVREGHNLLEVNSIIIDKDHSDISSIRERRRVHKTHLAHKSREKYFDKIWTSCGLEKLSEDDFRLKKEFASKSENCIYTSCLLRIALLQNQKLEEWQIYKAIRNAIQRRGYDANLPWKSALGDDDKENIELIKKYTQEDGIELINLDKYKYPCYYDALRLGLWSEDSPNNLSRKNNPQNNSNKVRCTAYVAPRNMVEKELIELFKNAQTQLVQLQKYSVDEFLYGDYREAYGSYVNPDYREFLGSNNDWQGVLGQKIPRFNNRIIAKCKLLPKRNVCKADTIENVSFTLLMKLKNLRVTDYNGEKIKLSPSEINEIYQNWLRKVENRENKLDTTITKKEIETVLGFKISDKIEPMKANVSGRSSFCRRACSIMNKVILSGELYPNNIDVTEFLDPENAKNGITEDEIRTMLSKIGDWNNLFIPDNRNENAELADKARTKTDIMIGNITNPIVRNRLQIFRDLLLDLYAKYEKPDEVIFEFVREGADSSLFGKVKAESALANMKNQEKENLLIKEELENANALSPINFEKLKLLKMQCGKCAYSGLPIGIGDFDKCEIDHIYPRTMGGNDALYNRVLCFRIENQKKAGRTPYEWLSMDKSAWEVYVNRLNEIKKSLGKKKYELLTSKPEDCAKLIDSYNGLAETSHIAKIAQQITAFIFNWGLQVEGKSRHIYVNNGASTHAIRKRYGLNKFLGNDVKKNRENDKHHALDAICISYSRDFKYDKNSNKDVIDGFNPLAVKAVIDSIMPYPYANKKPFKGNVRPLETIYGLRIYDDKSYITQRVDISTIEQKDKKIKSIIDEVIRKDLLQKLDENLSTIEWQNLLQSYIHPTKKTKVKKVMVVVSEGEITKDSNNRTRIGEYCDFGNKNTKNQFKHSKGHKGQILYYDQKNKIKVMPIYANQKTEDAKVSLQNMNCKLYNKGEIFYSGCLVEIEKPFEATVYNKIVDENGKEKVVSSREIVQEGLFKLRTIMGNGAIKLENNRGVEILTSATTLAGLNFHKLKS